MSEEESLHKIVGLTCEMGFQGVILMTCDFSSG